MGHGLSKEKSKNILKVFRYLHRRSSATQRGETSRTCPRFWFQPMGAMTSLFLLSPWNIDNSEFYLFGRKIRSQLCAYPAKRFIESRIAFYSGRTGPKHYLSWNSHLVWRTFKIEKDAIVQRTKLRECSRTNKYPIVCFTLRVRHLWPSADRESNGNSIVGTDGHHRSTSMSDLLTLKYKACIINSDMGHSHQAAKNWSRCKHPWTTKNHDRIFLVTQKVYLHWVHGK